MLALALLALLSATSNSDAFPEGRCYDRQCSFAPYKLAVTKDTHGKACFKFTPQECVDSPFKCCGKFNTTLTKVVFQARPTCKQALTGATINGTKKAGGVFFDLYKNATIGEVRITSMSLSRAQALATEICVLLRDPCPTLSSFCGSSNGGCFYALFDPLQHSCCPTCQLDIPPDCPCACPSQLSP